VHIGLPLAPENLWRDSAQLRWGPGPFNAAFNYNDPAWLVKEIDGARRMNMRLVLNLTGGKHERYISNGKFDLAKWEARMQEYNTPEIKAAIAAGVADGTIIMNSVMDEPNVKDWGGVMTKALLDQMAASVKQMFPTLKTAVALRYDWHPEERFRVIDVIVTMYAWWKGDVTKFRDEALAMGKRDGVAVMFSLNITDGGIHNWTTKDCPVPLTGGPGSYEPACRMTPHQVREWGSILGPAGCGLVLYRFDEAHATRPENLAALTYLADMLAKISPPPCTRS